MTDTHTQKLSLMEPQRADNVLHSEEGLASLISRYLVSEQPQVSVIQEKGPEVTSLGAHYQHCTWTRVRLYHPLSLSPPEGFATLLWIVM